MLKKKEKVAASHIQANYDKLMNMKQKLDTLIEKHALVDGEDELLTKLKAHRSKIDQSIVNLKKDSGDSLHFIQKHMEKRDNLVREIEQQQDETDPEIMKALARKKDDVETTKSEADMSPAEKARKEAQDLKKQIRAFERSTILSRR
jgi:hypothetical protein